MHDLGRSSVLSRSKAMQSWGEDTFRDIIRDELSVTTEQNQGYHNTTNQLIFYDLEEGDGPKPSVTISFLNKFETALQIYDRDFFIGKTFLIKQCQCVESLFRHQHLAYNFRI